MPRQPHYRRTPARGLDGSSSSSVLETCSIAGTSDSPATDTTGGSSTGGSLSSSIPRVLSPTTQEIASTRLPAIEEMDQAEAAPQAPEEKLGPRNVVGRRYVEPVGMAR